MANRVFIVGGSGQIGRACALAFAHAGWSVVCGQRNAASLSREPGELGVQTATLDRDEPGALEHRLEPGFDAVIDTVAFDVGHARQWIALQDRVGALAVISTGSVYADAQGRTLDEARTGGFPDYPVPMAEDQARTPPGEATYSTRKVALETALLDGVRIPLTILRPFAVYGPHNRAPREWWFMTRALRGDAEIPIAYDGLSRFHTSATANIAELCRVAVDRGGTQVLNAADPQALTVGEIGEAILEALGSPAQLSPFAGPQRGLEGWTPWSVAGPVVADMSAAEALGYRPVTDYRAAARETCVALLAAVEGRGWREAFPGLAAYPKAMFEPG